ncbi:MULTISPECIES: DUF4435 domain-containing protein [Rhizobium]|uniref:DUF4435 domain-containing protein n=1 Tax=Rhizobium TaxID=379 RepID=UPI0004626CEA|nr:MULTISPECIES: DUF4435 domain-containing protein [Rhizobium]MCS0460402.1 DUF4435 domain-containing protein [Rhizobium favelukesii]UFS80794.1 DUF4435 domain-containing protein [Rhizobium sp. T136]
MSAEKAVPTTDELFEVLKRSSLPTVLVEGKNDIIFYRGIEEELRDIGIDMLPAGNKDAVLELKQRLDAQKLSTPFAFVVDNDLWVHTGIPDLVELNGLITTAGYSVENDLFSDGVLLNLLTPEEKVQFHSDVTRFCEWYALSIHRHLNGKIASFRTHPGKVLDDQDFFASSVALETGETYPTGLYDKILIEFSSLLRGKSLFAILHRQLSKKGRDVKFSEKQLMAVGAAQKGQNFQRIGELVRKIIGQNLDLPKPGQG